MPQTVCKIDAEAPSCVHDRYVEVWGDHSGTDASPLLGLHYSKAELGSMYDNDFLPLLDTCWEYNQMLFKASEAGPLNDCEQAHRQRLALDLVALLSEARKRGLVF